MKHFAWLFAMGITGGLFAQMPDKTPLQPQAAQPSQAGDAASPSASGGAKPSSSPSSFLGKDIPLLDPGSEIVTWDGRNWNINNNRLFQARFEKFLNAPDSEDATDKKYQAIIAAIMDKLAPGKITPASQDEAFKLLPKAAEFEVDGHLCDALASQVQTAWLAKRDRARLAAANTSLEDERKRLEWNAKLTAQGSMLDQNISTTKSAEANTEAIKRQQLKRDMEMQPLLTRLAEVNALLKANQLKEEVAEAQVKIEFQALLTQLFLQRRFQHTLIGTRFYRAIFADGDSKLRVGKDAKNIFSKTSGMPPTVGTLDAMASEIMRDVAQGIAAFQYLLEKDELESATKRLGETFLIGEYLPEVRTLPREQKRQALVFAQHANQLLSAMEVKDYALAAQLITKLAATAKDFDSSKATAKIETDKAVAAMHIAKARNAAVRGDRETLETELRAAMELWPRNPALAEVSTQIFSQTDVQNRALLDFDQLLAQRNYRQIFDDRMRFIAATALYPDRQEQLRKVLEDMTAIETTIIRAQEIEKRGDVAGAWEGVERTFLEFPDDNKLNQLRADLTTKAAEFVHALSKAQDLEAKKQTGSSLAWFLKAQKEYPPSEFAKEGIQRLTRQILPDAS